jgi:hypothetical protein
MEIHFVLSQAVIKQTGELGPIKPIRPNAERRHEGSVGRVYRGFKMKNRHCVSTYKLVRAGQLDLFGALAILRTVLVKAAMVVSGRADFRPRRWDSAEVAQRGDAHGD